MSKPKMKTITHTVEFTLKVPEDTDPDSITLDISYENIIIFDCFKQKQIDGSVEEFCSLTGEIE